MRNSSAVFLCLIFCLFFQQGTADWWDDFVDGLHDKIVGGADFVKEDAGPAIRKKFNAAKESLQDPETHEKIQEWIKDKFLRFKSFINEDVAPEVQKIVEAAGEASKKRSSKDGTDSD